MTSCDRIHDIWGIGHRSLPELRGKSARDYLKTHKALNASYKAFVKSGGGTLEQLQNWLSAPSLPTLAQRKHMRLVVANQ
jgi:hypothetical protein